MLKLLKKYIILFAVLLMSLVSCAGSAITDISVLSSNLNGLDISYRPSPAQIDTFNIDDKTYSQFNYDYHTPVNPSGAPSVPARKVFFAAPRGIKPAIEIKYFSQSILPDIVLLPVPRLEKDQSGFFVEVFEENPAYYALSGYRPNSFAELGDHFEADGVSIWSLNLTPVLYDARALSAAKADSFDVHITFSAGKTALQSVLGSMPDYVINREAFMDLGANKAVSTNNPFANGEWYRITLKQNGMYNISGKELADAGFPVGSVKSDDICMFYGGGKLLKELPYELTTDDFHEMSLKIKDGGDGVFDKNDTIIFYGESLSRFIIRERRPTPYEKIIDETQYQNHLFSEENVYWLTISSEGEPKRIATFGKTSESDYDEITTYRNLKHLEYENMLELEKGGVEWYWEAITNKTKSYPFKTPNNVSGHPVNFRIGFLNQNKKLRHFLEIYVNDGSPASAEFYTIEKGSINLEFDAELSSSDNYISIQRIGNPTDFIHLDWIEIDYECELAFVNSQFEFFYRGDDKSHWFIVSNVSKSSIEIYDTTYPAVRENVSAVYDNEEKTLKFLAAAQKGYLARYTLCDPASYLKVSSISKKEMKNLRNPGNNANYIIISHNMFMEEAVKLASWRSHDSKTDPLIPFVVDVDDIYDEFNWGVFDPAAIRDFLKFTRENGDPNNRYYCCLIGDTSYKYKHLTENQAEKNFVPTFTDIDSHGVLTTDDYFTWYDKQNMPAFAIGRLCVSDSETAQILIDKIIEYERNPEPGLWHNRILFIADDELKEKGIGQDKIHSVQIENIESGSSIPDNFERLKIMQVEYPLKNLRKPDVTEALLSAINDGYLIANYIGHGNDDLLAHEHILVGTRDIERFNNAGRMPLFILASCAVGNFTQTDNISLAELLHLNKNGSCIGVIAASSETYSNPNYKLNEEIYRNLFNRDINPDCRIGYALQVAKHYIQGENSSRYQLFGDPATRLMIPRYGFSVSSADTVFRLQKLDLSGSVTDGENKIPYNGKMHIRARGPKIHKTYYTNRNINAIKYTQPGKTFYLGELAISGDSFDTALVIPKDVPSTDDNSAIYLFATGEGIEATGTINDFTIGGLYKNAPDDRHGPEIELEIDGKIFSDGAFINHQPTLKATISDSSSINIYGNRGHNITLIIDKTESFVLTDRFKTIDGYTTGVLEYTLPILSPGEHILDMNVYDTYNNATKKRVIANVYGSKTGDITIMNLLTYPNPMSSDGTNFTFSLTDNSRYADIKVYSQSGRLVDSIRFPAEYGFNKHHWKPPFVLANGVYFYKLTVKSVNGRASSKIEKLVVMR
ncbi:MAG: type IX secretion system sortase PorU [Candidatus Latescibacteria bacterium]|jgi:hypothetical protein|nr:type IX secretion system sortase PorU [Candidatus Latescibacterota bacterium]